MKRTRRTPGGTLSSWLARIAADGHGEQLDPRLIAVATDVVDTLHERPAGVHGAVYRFGNTLGADGWPGTQVFRWLFLLGDLLGRPQRVQLGQYPAQAALAQGWADGYVRGAHAGLCFDPTTGLVTALVLRLRLREAYGVDGAASIRPADAYTVVLVDVELRRLPPLEAGLLMLCVADAVKAVFHRGETIARVGDRIVVLAANDQHTRRRTEDLADRLWLDANTRGANATVLLDTLPAAGEVLDRYLRDLVA